MTPRVVLPIRHGDVLLGFLWVIVGDQPLTDAERAVIARGGAEVADNLWGRLREADERRTRINALLARAFAGEHVGPDLAATLRWPATGTFAVVVSRGGDEIPSACAGAAAPPTSPGWRRTTRGHPRPRPGAVPGRRADHGGCGGRAQRPLRPARRRPRRAPPGRDRGTVRRRLARTTGPVADYDELGSWALIATLWIAAGRPFPPPRSTSS